MKGIVLAGGKGTRLDPLTRVCSKQLLPVYDRPMICYPLHVLQKVIGLSPENIAIITMPESIPAFQKLFTKDYYYILQPEPRGIAEAPILAEEWLDGDDYVLILGDNLFTDLHVRWPWLPNRAALLDNTIFITTVRNPRRYGCFNESTGEFVEKPGFDGNWKAVVGIYFLIFETVEIARQLAPSARGELEILDVIRECHKRKRLSIQPLHGAWFDCGDFEELLAASEMVRSLRLRHNSQLGIL